MIGFATFNRCPHLPIDIPDGGFTLTVKTSHNCCVAFYFGLYQEGGPPEFIDIQYQDRGSTIPDARGEPGPTFDFLGICRGSVQCADSRQLEEPDKPSILALLLDQLKGSPAAKSRGEHHQGANRTEAIPKAPARTPPP